MIVEVNPKVVEPETSSDFTSPDGLEWSHRIGDDAGTLFFGGVNPPVDFPQEYLRFETEETAMLTKGEVIELIETLAQLIGLECTLEAPNA